MNKPKITTGFSRYNDAELEQKAELIVDSMTDNEHFPTPTVSIEDLKSEVEAFDQAIVAAKEGGKMEIKKREEKRASLIEKLEKLALYVQMIGDGNEAILLSSGYSLAKHPQKVGVLPKPENFSVHADTAGMVKLRLKSIHGAKSYRYEYRKEGENDWESIVHTQSQLLVTDLESGQKYQFRVAGIGTEKERVYSDIISSYVL